MDFNKLFLDTAHSLSSINGEKTVFLKLNIEQLIELDKWIKNKKPETVAYVDITPDKVFANSVFVYGIKFIFNETN